jgi:hypothetical protein
VLYSGAMSKLLHLKAEWYRHALHDASLRAEHRIPANELRKLVASFGQILLTSEDEEE